MTEALPMDKQNKSEELGAQGLASMFGEPKTQLPTGIIQPQQVAPQGQMQLGQVAPQTQNRGLAAYSGLQGQQQINQPQNQYQVMGGAQLI